MQNNRTRQEIENIVHKTCRYMGPLEVKCDRFVEEYGDIAIQLLADEISPREICALMGVCQFHDTVLQSKRIKRIKKKLMEIVKIGLFSESVAECSLCRMMNSVLKTLLKSRREGEKLEYIVSQVCNEMPSDVYNKVWPSFWSV